MADGEESAFDRYVKRACENTLRAQMRRYVILGADPVEIDKLLVEAGFRPLGGDDASGV